MVEPKDPTAAFYNYPGDFQETVVKKLIFRTGAAIAAAITGNAPWSDVWGKSGTILAAHVCCSQWCGLFR